MLFTCNFVNCSKVPFKLVLFYFKRILRDRSFGDANPNGEGLGTDHVSRKKPAHSTFYPVHDSGVGGVGGDEIYHIESALQWNLDIMILDITMFPV